MPIIAAVVGAFLTGLIYWFRYGDGMETIDGLMRNERDRKRRAAAVDQQKLAPVRSIKEPREAGIALAVLVAEARGEPTPEQIACIEGQMHDVLGYGPDQDGAARLAFARHATSQAGSADAVIDILVPLLRGALNRDERSELGIILDRVAVLHGGPTAEQTRIIERTTRRLSEAV